jgi:CHASE2 domain-containing sensor protein
VKREDHSRLAEFIHGALLVTVAVAITALLHGSFIVRDLERANLDSFYSLMPVQTPANIEVVTVTDEDYPQFVGTDGALDRDKLMDVVRGIAAAGAKVIAIDILTPSWPQDTEAKLGVTAPIVWVRGVHGEEENDVRLDPVLGGDGVGLCQGPFALHEVAGIAREYEPVMQVPKKGLVPSFTTVVKKVFEKNSKEGCMEVEAGEHAGKEVIPYIGKSSSFRHTSASTILTASKQPDWPRKKLMDGKIVLLGGTFAASRDDYRTPVESKMYGVDILANIIAAETSDQWIDEAGWLLFLFVDWAVGLLLVFFGTFIRGLRALALSLGLVVLVALGSVFLFEAFRFYISFMPVFAGLVVHFLLEHWQSDRKLAAKNARLESENAELKARLHTVKPREN